MISNGDAANGVNAFSFSGRIIYNRNGQEFVATSGISLLTTELPSTGGETIEGVESIKKYAQGYMRLKTAH